MKSSDVLRGYEGLTAYRITSYDTPTWVSRSRAPGRWRGQGSDPVQGLGLEVAVPLAEYLRYSEIRDAAFGAELKMTLWELRVTESLIVDLTDPEVRDHLGVKFDELVGDDWGPCQRLAERLVQEGARGLVAPSAALPGGCTVNLVGPRVEIDWEREPALAVQIPARRLVTVSAPDPELLAEVRHRGTPYPRDGLQRLDAARAKLTARRAGQK